MGLAYAELTLDLALAFHHAVRDDHAQVAAVIARLREDTRSDYAYYSYIAAFMGDLPLEEASPARWIDGGQTVPRRWRTLVAARRDHLRQQ
ncbi:hypothetical protein [Streptomyces europaeiscabiei]|uniref:hypothetical protein n=1 Tax=Streptomyces europaeiscabiei TaxID=146819 RepID=UPI002E117448|nr:hypothetical protein OHB30_51115 [Streptomyces europaeiscabiei]